LESLHGVHHRHWCTPSPVCTGSRACPLIQARGRRPSDDAYVQQSAPSLPATAPATGRTRKPCRVPVKAREGAARDTGANQVPWTENALGSCRAKNTIRVGYGPRHRSLWYETSAVFKKCRGSVPGSLGRAFRTEGPRPPGRRHFALWLSPSNQGDKDRMRYGWPAGGVREAARTERYQLGPGVRFAYAMPPSTAMVSPTT